MTITFNPLQDIQDRVRDRAVASTVPGPDFPALQEDQWAALKRWLDYNFPQGHGRKEWNGLQHAIHSTQAEMAEFILMQKEKSS